jgi:hypothetical protein
MTSRAELPQNVAGPAFGLEIDITQGNTNPPLDLTTITALTLTVSRVQDGSTATWVPAIVPGGTPTSQTARYVFASDGSDARALYLYRVAVSFMTNNGPIPGTSFDLFVVPANQWQAATSVFAVSTSP